MDVLQGRCSLFLEPHQILLSYLPNLLESQVQKRQSTHTLRGLPHSYPQPPENSVTSQPPWQKQEPALQHFVLPWKEEPD